jgi:hypothetical protein
LPSVLFDERVVDGALDLLFGDGEPDAAVALRVHVDEERLLPESREAGGEIDARRRLPAAALLIDDGDRSHARPSLADLRAANPSAAALAHVMWDCPNP